MISHLFRRFFQSLSRSAPDETDVLALQKLMSDAEFALWSTMSPSDRRHSLKVVARFRGHLSDATNAEIVGVALHDVGKVASNLGTFARVMATIVGPRTRRFRIYHDHESIGLRMLREIGCSSQVAAILDGTARQSALASFRWADNC